MAVLRQSPWYQQILQEGQQLGIQQGLQQGIQQGQILGIQQGQKQESYRYLMRLVRSRFNTIPTEIETNLQKLSVEELENLGDCLLRVNSLEEFIAAIPVNTEEETE